MPWLRPSRALLAAALLSRALMQVQAAKPGPALPRCPCALQKVPCQHLMPQVRKRGTLLAAVRGMTGHQGFPTELIKALDERITT